MGQQQLILLLLSIVIVGIAISVGITMWGEANRQNRADDVLRESVRLAQEAINWRGRAEWYGGGGGTRAPFDPLASGGFDVMGVEGRTMTTEHRIQSASGQTLEIVGISTQFPEIGAYVRIQNGEIDSTAIRRDGSISLP